MADITITGYGTVTTAVTGSDQTKKVASTATGFITSQTTSQDGIIYRELKR